MHGHQNIKSWKMYAEGNNFVAFAHFCLMISETTKFRKSLSSACAIHYVQFVLGTLFSPAFREVLRDAGRNVCRSLVSVVFVQFKQTWYRQTVEVLHPTV
jgi:hypothetical protein